MRPRRFVELTCLMLVFVLLAAQAAFGIVPLTGAIAGVVHRPDGTPMTTGSAWVFYPNGMLAGQYLLGGDGSWSAPLVSGQYKVYHTQSGSYANGFYTPTGLVPLRSMGTTLTVSAGTTTSIEATFPVGAAIKGRVIAHATGLGVHNDINVFYQDPGTGEWQNVYGVASADDGFYQATQLLPGTYRLRFYDDIYYRYLLQYWNGKPDLASADGITVGLGQTVNGYNVVLSADVTSETVAGPGRIDTAIDASKKMYPDATTHADAVIITNGYNWPDALGGSALAGAMNAPVLLNAAPPAAMPTTLDDEVVRLKDNGATDAYILGDTNAVSAGVETRLAQIFGSATKVHRLGATGRSRYATSLDIANAVKAKQGAGWAGTVFLAKGGDYPDALAASPLAGKKGWPIILAEGDGHGGLSARVKAFLAANATTKVIILGSTNAVPLSVELSAVSAVGPGKIERWFGGDRIATAIDIADHSVANGMSYDGIGIATGYGFADALCGGAYLAKKNNPLLLSADYLPLRLALAIKLTALSPTVATVRFLGGPAAVRPAVRNAVVDRLR